MVSQSYGHSVGELGARIWVEWIDSKSNPSDGLSVQGLAMSITGSHSRKIPGWGAPALYPQKAMTAVL